MKLKSGVKYVVIWVENIKDYSPVTGDNITYKRRCLKKYRTKTGMMKCIDRATKKCNEDGVAIFRVVGVVRDKLDMIPFLKEEGKYES